MKILYINSCVRAESRTRILAEAVLKKISTDDDEIIECNLEKECILPLTSATLANRDRLIAEGKFDDEIFRYARDLAEADIVVLAAPLWDMTYPASVKAYIENTMITGLVFSYTSDGMPKSLCKAKKLYYVSTAGGPVFPPHQGFNYVKLISENFWGIKDNKLVLAAMLDIDGMDADALIAEKLNEIARW